MWWVYSPWLLLAKSIIIKGSYTHITNVRKMNVKVRRSDISSHTNHPTGSIESVCSQPSTTQKPPTKISQVNPGSSSLTRGTKASPRTDLNTSSPIRLKRRKKLMFSPGYTLNQWWERLVSYRPCFQVAFFWIPPLPDPILPKRR